MTGIGIELGAASPQLLAVMIATAAPSVGVPATGCGAHDDRFQSREWNWHSYHSVKGHEKRAICTHPALTTTLSEC
ncbi:hypothetical protein [Streptomyces sp. H39-S7]|uniref:hypothetical protein n=1 Tax=Streptomyces sp. H39-S7 TaxID=3004357 RepID=UPI0022AFACC1|nr:hypothetical protein [Streptomyces sp. H39-S7]MCZ4118996.1 hypothetical protein [Streptomyces sp. H39-S7]